MCSGCPVINLCLRDAEFRVARPFTRIVLRCRELYRCRLL